MVFVTKIQYLSSITSYTTTQLQKASNFALKPVSYIHYASSPFTEKHSVERYKMDGWLYKNELEEQSPSCNVVHDSEVVRDYDIEMQLPELKKMLEVLKEKRERENGGRGDVAKNVFLVGTWHGDPELVTIKALKVIQYANLLLYDRLVSNDVLDLVGANARLLYVGKTVGYHSRTQVTFDQKYQNCSVFLT